MCARPQLCIKEIVTPLGVMRAGADAQSLYFLHFADTASAYADLWAEEAPCSATDNAVLAQLEAELSAYFSGHGSVFTVPLQMQPHSAFRQGVWLALRSIPPGQTRSYRAQAATLGYLPAYTRAVAAAHGKNPFPLILPCHRVVGSDGKLKGYNGGLERKQALLAHEHRYFACE